MPRCALLTLDQRGDFVIDDELALQPLADIGWQASMVSWRQKAVPWSAFDLVIVRSTWDYWNDVPGFLRTLAEIDAATLLANPLGLMRWNLSKTYLRDLRQSGVPIVPTLWVDRIAPDTIASAFGQLGAEQVVVKPVVGANGEDVFRITAATGADALATIGARFRDRAAMLQPFMPAILSEGEFSLFFFNGAFSHATLRVPARGEFRSQEERGASVTSIRPEPQLRARGQQAMASLQPAPLYARIDLVRDDDGDFCVMELELIEPSLYLRTEPGAPGRFAAAVDRWFKTRGRQEA